MFWYVSLIFYLSCSLTFPVNFQCALNGWRKCAHHDPICDIMCTILLLMVSDCDHSLRLRCGFPIYYTQRPAMAQECALSVLFGFIDYCYYNILGFSCWPKWAWRPIYDDMHFYTNRSDNNRTQKRHISKCNSIFT